jgi:Tfp pilus assembly protein PilW
MGRKRGTGTGLPKYLYRDGSEGRWKYAHPEYIKAHGRPKRFTATEKEAVALAAQANTKLTSMASSASAGPVQRAGPKAAGSFYTMCDEYLEYWTVKQYQDPEQRPQQSTETNTRNRLKQAKRHFGDRAIHTIDTFQMAKYYKTIQSPHEYAKIKNLMDLVFKYAKSEGHLPAHAPNPGAEAGLKRVPRATIRKPMTPDQYTAIYERSSPWLQS